GGEAVRWTTQPSRRARAGARHGPARSTSPPSPEPTPGCSAAASRRAAARAYSASTEPVPWVGLSALSLPFRIGQQLTPRGPRAGPPDVALPAEVPPCA